MNKPKKEKSKADKTREKLATTFAEQLVASHKAVNEVERSVLDSLVSYSETLSDKMDELVNLGVPSSAERRGAEKVREQVLALTRTLVDELARNIPKPSDPQ